MADESLNRFLAIQTGTGWGRALKSFAAWCQPQPGWKTLDVGCGPGLLPALFQQAGCQAWGIDHDPAAFQPAPLHPGVCSGFAEALPFPRQAFHLVTASNVLFLLPDPLPALQEMRRVLRTEGWIAVLNPSEVMSLAAAQELADQNALQGMARESLLDWAQRAEAHRRWNERELGELFTAAGLRLLRSDLRVGPGLARLAAGQKQEED